MIYIVWRTLEILKLIPSQNAPWLNGIGLVVWMLNISTAGIYMSIFDPDLRATSNLSFSSLLVILFLDILQPLQEVLSFLAVAVFVKQQKLWQDVCSLIPQRPWHLLIRTVFQVGAFSLLAYYYVPRYSDPWFQLAISCTNIFNVLVMSTAVFAIGLGASRFCRNVQEITGTESVECLKITYLPMLKEFQNLKQHLQPMLLVIFAMDSTLLTGVAYIVSKDRTGLILLPYVLYIILNLSYIVYVLADCLDNLKSLVEKLR